GIQGAPGVGFSLTADGNNDMNKKRLTNVGAPSANTDAATKKYVDDNSGGSPSTTRLTVDSNIDMKDQYRILNLKHPVDADEPATKQYSDSRFLDRNGSRTMIGNLSMNNNKIIKVGTPTANDDAATKKYVDDKSNYVDNTFLDRDGSYPMKGNLNMANNRIFNLPAPNGGNQPTPLAFTDLKYVARDGSSTMTNNLNIDNKKIINLRPPTSDTDGANKKYVDDNVGGIDLNDYLEKDGTVTMTGNLNVGNNKIINLSDPTTDQEAANRGWVRKQIERDDSHSNSVFWVSGNRTGTWSLNIHKSWNYDMSGVKLRTHNNSNHSAITCRIFTDLPKAITKPLKRIEINTPNIVISGVVKSDINLDGNKIKNLGAPTQDNEAATKNYADKLVNHTAVQPSHYNNQFDSLMSNGTDLAVYPRQFSKVYIITYGIVGTFSNIDPDKVYDYHTAFDIKPTEVLYNVDINANNKKILNVNLDRNNNNSAATVGMVKEIKPHTINDLYRNYFEEVYDFTNATNYKLSRTSSGIVFNYLSSSSGNTLRDMGIPLRTIDDIKKEGLNDIFEFNHIDKSLSESEVNTLKDFYKHYHKKYWCFKKSYKSYKFLDDVFTIAGISLVAIGTVSGGITLNPVVLGVVNGAG
ncbi:unnamed protein product, partial [Porites lobata]